MKTFNNKLEIGQPAMIINTAKEINRSLIGKVVIVEALTSAGEEVSEFFDAENKRIVEVADGMAFCSGVNPPERIKCEDGTLMKLGVTRFRISNLMPLPPLGDKEIQKEKELEFS